MTSMNPSSAQSLSIIVFYQPFNLSKDEFESLCKLKNENNLAIQNADKGNTIVILGKDSYLKDFLKSFERFFKIQGHSCRA